ncbi:MAG: ParB/RepB/Spo0J family partition protein [Sulfitobacter sp.]
MVKKRSVFDIDFDPEEDDARAGGPGGNERAPETKAFNVQGHPLQNHGAVPARRGPMASAIVETADASAARAGAEAAIRAENDALAHEHVRLKKLGLITDLIETAQVHTTRLIRDRSRNADPELAELKESIKSVGLSNPIRVAQADEGYELIQGFRRLNAFRELAEETGDARYTRIPAALVPRGEPLKGLYRTMVDENLVRKDLSFGEMAQLALSYAGDAGIDVGEAVTQLYASALKQKRSYIRQFARLLEDLEGVLRFPEAIPRALGIDLSKALDATPGRAQEVVAALREAPRSEPQDEIRILQQVVGDKPKPVAPQQARSMSKTSLRIGRPEGEAKVIASDGRVDLRLNRDFSAVPKATLQRGIEAFLEALDDEE